MATNRTIKFEHEVTPSMVSDLITTFIESGGYCSWCEYVKFYTWDATNTRVNTTYLDTWKDGSTFYEGKWSIDIKVDDGKIVTIGWKKLKWALERAEVKDAVRRFIDEEMDVEDADSIIQMAVFKEIVYG